jgi:hypothetical protein
MVLHRKSALLFRHVPGDQRHRNVNVDERTAAGAENVVVPINPGVVTTGLISEAQFLDFAMLSQQVKRAIDSAVRNPRIALSHALEDFPRGQVAIRFPHHIENHRALYCFAIALCH